MFYERLETICLKNGITVSYLVKALELSTSKVTAWKNGSVPKGDNLAKIADYLNCSVDYLLGRVDKPNQLLDFKIKGDRNTMLNIIELKSLSESQRAMLKCRINQLMINHFQTDNFFVPLNEKLGVENSYTWFNKLNDFSLDEMVSKMLELLNTNTATLFKKMDIVIGTKATAQALAIEYSDDANFPILVAGDKIFKALSTLSLSTLSLLEKGLVEQIKPRIPRSDISDDLQSELASAFNSKIQI